MSTGVALAVAAVLILANGVFVAVEFALLAARRTSLEETAQAGNRRAAVAVTAMKDLSTQLAGAQLGITMASLGLGFVAEPAIGPVLESWLEPFGLPHGATVSASVAIALVIVVFLHMVIGEMVPKNIAIAQPERTAIWLAVPNRVYVTAFRPVIGVLNGLANLGLRLAGVEVRDELAQASTVEELGALLTAARDEGMIAEARHELLRSALGFADQRVVAVTIPRSRIVAVAGDDTVADVERAMLDSGHSRLPVTEDGLDDVVGFLHAKDLLGLPAAQRVPSRLVRPMLEIRPDWSLERALLLMQRERVHLALVVEAEPQRRTVGIASLEDVVQVLVGDISGEAAPTS